jgi:diketogulonate reductase-like aldo/keto reductase
VLSKVKRHFSTSLFSIPLIIRFLLLFHAVVAVLALDQQQPQEQEQQQHPNESRRSHLMYNPTVKLHNGVEMPLFSLGTAHLVATAAAASSSDDHDDPVLDPLPPGFLGMLPERTYRQVELALQAGIRAFDTAHIYRSQRAMGHVLGEWWRRGGGRRNDVWLTTKIFHPLDARPACFASRHMPTLSTMTVEQVTVETRRFFEEALDELGVGYVDLMLLHWPAGAGQNHQGGSVELNRQQRLAAWQVLEEMYAKGWCRAIGVSNFSVDHLRQLQEDGAFIVPMVNQIEASVMTQYRDIREYCKKNGIVPQAYSPFRGMTSSSTSTTRDASSSSTTTASSSTTIGATLAALATKYGKGSSGQIILRYLFQHGYAMVYLSSSEQRMLSNMNIFDFALIDDEMQALDQLNRNESSWGLPAPYEIY